MCRLSAPVVRVNGGGAEAVVSDDVDIELISEILMTPVSLVVTW